MGVNDPLVQHVGSIVGGHLEQIAKLFKPGVKLTIVIRRPDAPDGSQDMVLTDDTFDAVITALQQRKAADA